MELLFIQTTEKQRELHINLHLLVLLSKACSFGSGPDPRNGKSVKNKGLPCVWHREILESHLLPLDRTLTGCWDQEQRRDSNPGSPMSNSGSTSSILTTSQRPRSSRKNFLHSWFIVIPCLSFCSSSSPLLLLHLGSLDDKKNFI